VSREDGMTDAELAAERGALLREHAELKAQHRLLEGHPGDVPGHIEHARRLHDHVDRLRALTDALLARKKTL
jgi:hypothetical protein